MSFAYKTRVGVLRGGPSPEYEISLQTGANILKNLPEEYEPLDIFISREGIWHDKGLEKSPTDILRRVDVIINGLHGRYGEDGEVQKLLEQFNVPYIGSRPFSSALALNKNLAKRIYQDFNLKTPNYISLPFEKLSRGAIKAAYQNLLPPFIVKPSATGSSIGIYVVDSLPELEEAVIAASQLAPVVIVEEYVKGKEAAIGVIESFRGQDRYALPPVEIRHGKEFFDYQSKYGRCSAEEICPGNFTERESQELCHLATEAHRMLGLRHYSRSDFIVHPKRGIFILETNPLPGLTEKSLMPKALSAIGSNLKEFLSHLLKKVLNKK